MKLIVLDKKKFQAQFSRCQTGLFALPPYGTVEVEYTEDILHKLTPSSAEATHPLPQFNQLVVAGTEFQAKVWHALLTIPSGTQVTYSDIARLIGYPKAVRAVGTAVGANPIGILIPCHRVIAKNGKIGGFAWGTELKEKWLALESTKAHP